VLISILDQFERRWQQLLARDDEALLADYRERCFLTGRTVTLEQPGERRLVGACDGIDGQGRLLLRTPDGLVAASSGTVAAWEP
jgi:biotin-(acetyl-CoA carboxylase) ligase